MVSVLWDESVGALSYTATLERTDGETTCCTANSTSCEVTSLPCGQMYVLTVTAEGRTCNSSQSFEVIVRSGNTHWPFNPVTNAALRKLIKNMNLNLINVYNLFVFTVTVTVICMFINYLLVENQSNIRVNSINVPHFTNRVAKLKRKKKKDYRKSNVIRS